MTAIEFPYNPLLMRMRGLAPAGTGVCGFFETWDKKKLFYRIWDAPHATKIVACLHGAFGHGEYFSLIADKLVPRDIAVAVFDYRGHGRSEGQHGDVVKYTDWYQDARAFLEFLSLKVQELHGKPLPIFQLGESMGGGLAAGISAWDPALPVAGFILFAPAVKFHFTQFSLIDALKVIPMFFSHVFAPRKRVFNTTGRESTGIADPVHQEYDKTDPLHLKKVTPRYLLQMNKASKLAFIKGPAATNHPVLIMQGADDPAIDPEGVRDYFQRLIGGGDKKLVIVAGGRHSLFDDPVFQPHWQEVFNWLDSH
jgi:alpha-beta hydrolase superfamily lysophospholipase